MRLPRTSNPPQHPPQYQSVPHFVQKFRFKASAVMSNLAISTADLMGLLLTCSTDESAVNHSWSLLAAFRLRKVSLWAPPAADLAPVTASVEFFNATTDSGFGQRRYVHSDTSVGATRVAAVTAVPPNGSPCASFQNVASGGTGTTNGTAFILNGPAGTIIDVDLDCVLQNGETPFEGPTPAAYVPGAIYLAKLDGSSGPILDPLNYRPFPY